MSKDKLRTVLIYLFVALAFFLPLSFDYELPGGVNLTIFSEPIMALITLLLPLYFIKNIGFKALTTLDKLVLVYLIAVLISTIFSVDKIVSFKYFITVCWFTASGYFLPSFLKLSRSEWKKVGFAFVGGTSILGFYVLYQHTQLGIFNQSSYMVARPFVYQGHTNLTSMIEPALLILLFLFYYNLPKKWTFITYILLISYIYIIDFSCSRASFITTLMIFGIYLILLPLKKKFVFAAVIFIGIFSSYWIRYANDYYHENYVRQPLKPYDPNDRTTWKGTTTYAIEIDDEEVIKYREEHDGSLIYEEALKPKQEAQAQEENKQPLVDQQSTPEQSEPVTTTPKEETPKIVEAPPATKKVESVTPVVESTPSLQEEVVQEKPSIQSSENQEIAVEQSAPQQEVVVEVKADPEPVKEESSTPPVEEAIAQETDTSAPAEEENPLEKVQHQVEKGEVTDEEKTTAEIYALTSKERLEIAPTSQTNKELDILNFDDNHSNVERKNRWIAGLYFFKEFPITGIGVGTFSDYYLSDYYGKGLVEHETVVSAKKMNIHNIYLGWICEGGVLLGIAGLLVLLFCIKKVFDSVFGYGLSMKGIMKAYKRLRISKGLMLIFLASFVLHGVVQDFANEPRVIVIFWTGISLFQYYGNKKRSLKSTSKKG